MDYVNIEKNEDAFLRWERQGSWTTNILWATPALLTFMVLFLLFLTLTGEWEVVTWELPLIVTVLIIYATVPVVIQWCIIKQRLRELAKDACIYTAMSAAEDLERGNPVRASLSMGELLLALSDLLEQESVVLGVNSVTPMEIMHVTPRKIPKRAVFRAVQANEDTKDFQERLRNLSVGLPGNIQADYLVAHQFLVWLDRKTEPYQHASQNFLDKHPTMKILGPSILAALALIVVESLRQLGG